MGGNIFFCFIIGILLLILIAAAAIIYKCNKAKKKVRQTPYDRKVKILDDVAAPFGFTYVSEKDLFSSRLTAWQRQYGYEALFDYAAGVFHMIIDTWPVYFNYDGKTWLIEFWKGQYGISTGAEIGVYHADHILSENEYKTAHFDSAENNELVKLQFCLKKKGKEIACMERRHWWLTAFLVGEFSRLKDLTLYATLTFHDSGMAESFFEGFKKSSHPSGQYCPSCNEICVRMDFTEKHPWWKRCRRAVIQLLNLLCCKLYLCLTGSFHCTLDRVLYLYYLLPGCVRKILGRRSRHLTKRNPHSMKGCPHSMKGCPHSMKGRPHSMKGRRHEL